MWGNVGARVEAVGPLVYWSLRIVHCVYNFVFFLIKVQTKSPPINGSFRVKSFPHVCTIDAVWFHRWAVRTCKFHFTSLWAAAAVSTSRSSPMPPLPYSLSIAHGSNVVDAPVPDRPRDDGDANASVCADAELIWSAFT